jgi:polysaccharide biosynthesis/export protein
MTSRVRCWLCQTNAPAAGIYGRPRPSGVALLGTMLLGGCWLLRGQAPAAPRVEPDTPIAVSEEDLRVASEAIASVKAQSAVGTAPYLVSPEDLLEVMVFDVPELSHDYRVTAGGGIVMPLLAGPIPAVGLTLEQLGARIGERLRAAGLVTNAQVTVMVKESRAHAIAVVGAVRQPQSVRALGRTTFLDVVSQAGGFTDDVGNTAIISRGEMALRALENAAGKENPGAASAVPGTVIVNLRELLASGDSRLNLDVYPGDRVTVKRAGIVYVVGAVARPGGFTLKTEHEELTVLKALALAENMKSTAREEKGMILRKNSEAADGRDEIPVNLKLIMANRAPDVPLRANDVLFVPDSTSKKAIRKAAETMVGFGTAIGTGLIIYRR